MNQLRLQKYLAEAGVASRRAGERLILAGQVAVNGQVIHELGTKVHPQRDLVEVNGLPVRPRRKIHLVLHKPRGYHCTRLDAASRNLIGELLPPDMAHLFSVGRLDAASEGLLILTNDGDFSQKIAHPSYGIRKIYRVEVRGKVHPPIVRQLTHGVLESGESLQAKKVTILYASHSRSELEVVLLEGKNREIRRMLRAVGLQVTRLKRIQIGNVKLGELPVGKWRTLTESEIKSLLPKV
jgi:23S rRNA pseudouridine2605 synthase